MFTQLYCDHLLFKMHLLVTSLMCCVFVLTGMHAEDAEKTEDAELYNCTANVPPEAAEAVLDAINGKRAESKKLGLRLQSITENDCSLAKEAFTNTFDAQKHQGFDIKSAFDDDWKEALKKELLSRDTKGMINAAKNAGCGIKLKTSETDGSHEIKVECALE